MTVAVLGILVALWLAVLVPPALRYVTGERRRADSVDDFNDVLTVLGRTNGHRTNGHRTNGHRTNGRTNGHGVNGQRTPAVSATGAMTSAQRRRRDVLFGLSGTVGASVILALLLGGRVFWGLVLVSMSLLVGYVWLLVQHRQRAMERRSKVRYLPSQAVRRTEFVPARVASGR